MAEKIIKITLKTLVVILTVISLALALVEIMDRQLYCALILFAVFLISRYLVLTKKQEERYKKIADKDVSENLVMITVYVLALSIFLAGLIGCTYVYHDYEKIALTHAEELMYEDLEDYEILSLDEPKVIRMSKTDQSVWCVIRRSYTAKGENSETTDNLYTIVVEIGRISGKPHKYGCKIQRIST